MLFMSPHLEPKFLLLFLLNNCNAHVITFWCYPVNGAPSYSQDGVGVGGGGLPPGRIKKI
jgi:hypothetical protein